MSATADTDRLPRSEALDQASRAMRSLAPYCERIEIAGSIRRHMKTVGDIEIVAVPKMQRVQVGLFDDDVKMVSELETVVTTYLAHPGPWALRVSESGRAANGPKLKRLTYDGFGVDLFVVTPPAQWGVIFTIRTGPYLFSKQLVSHANVRIEDPYSGGVRYGVLPQDMKVEHGALWRGGQADPIDTPEETDFFRAIGRECIDPWRRQ